MASRHDLAFKRTPKTPADGWTFYIYGPGGKLLTSRMLDFGHESRKMCLLDLSLTVKFGVKLDRFGDSDCYLAEI